MAEKYSIIRYLGEGSYGKCYLVQEKSTKKRFAVKEINTARMSKASVDCALREGNLMSKLRHPFIVGLKEVIRTRQKICIVMEYAEGGDLNRYVKSYGSTNVTETEVKRLMVQLCLALKYLHEHSIIHRDLKPENVFLSHSSDVKLGDFGVSKQLNAMTDLTRTYIGTPYYLSPEIARNERYGCKTDIWSLGVMIHELCSKKPPFQGRALPPLIEAIIAQPAPPLPRCYSPSFNTLISSMLHKSPTHRPTIKDVLNHPALSSALQTQLSQGLELNITIKQNTIKQLRQPRTEIRAVLPGKKKPEEKIFGRDPEMIPKAVIMQNFHERESEKQALIREIEGKKEVILQEDVPIAPINEHEEMEKDYKENQLKVLEVQQAILEGPGEVRVVETPPVQEVVEREYGDLDVPSLPIEPRPAVVPQAAVPRLGQGTNPEVLRRNIQELLGRERFEEVYRIMSELKRHVFFSDKGISSYRPHLQHLLSLRLQIICVPQVKLLLRLDSV